MLKEYLIKKLLDVAYEKAKTQIKDTKSKLAISKDEIQVSLEYHLAAVKNWAEEVSFADLKKAKRTTDIFLELDVFVYPRRLRISQQEHIASIPIKTIFAYSSAHLILLGLPGAGKTTSMKHICQSLFYDETYFPDRFSCPVVIKFRELNDFKTSPDSTLIIDALHEILGLKIQFPDELCGSDKLASRRSIKEKAVISLLDELRVLLILDGFDELTDITRRQESIRDLSLLASHLEHATIVLTSRTGDFVYSIDNTTPLEICPLSREQIATFARKWLSTEKAAGDFLAKIYESPFADTTIRPLNLAHLCAIYERIGKIPDKPKTVYRKIVNLLLEEWDGQRAIKRLSLYGKFEVDRKFEFLTHVAYVLTTALQKTVFTNVDLVYIYNTIHQDYGLMGYEARRVVGEIETHTGLLVQTCYEEFEFAHKSLQEYLTSEYLVKLPSIPAELDILLKLPNELAIAVTISSKPSEYFSELVLYRLITHRLSEDFIEAFLTRLILEKPDFNTSTRLGLAFITLFTKIVECNANPFSTVIAEIEKLVKPALQKGSIHTIKQSYQRDGVHDNSNNERVYRFVKKKGIVHQGLSHLPHFLYVKEAFLQERVS